MSNITIDSREMKYNQDVILSIMEYLYIEEIFNSFLVCRCWHCACDFTFFDRLQKSRNTMKSQDYGNGSSVMIDIRKLDQFKMHILYRERIENIIISKIDPFTKLRFIISYCCNNTNNRFIQIESWRFITQLFDEYLELNHKNKLPIIKNQQFLKHIIKELNEPSVHLQIVAKLIGILAINESNREIFAALHFIPKLLKALQDNIENKPMIACIIWSLVILSRPIGAVEAQEIDNYNEKSLKIIIDIIQLNTVPFILKLAKYHKKEPLILSKVFWLIVNLSLIAETKKFIAINGGIEIICDAMKLYKDDKELQYRAIFAIVNVGINSIAKQRFLKQNGVELILNAMKHKQYSNDIKFLSMCVNSLRSLSSHSQLIVDHLIKNNAKTILKDIAEKYSEYHHPLSFSIQNTINTFQL